MELITRSQAQKMMNIKSPLTFRIRIAEANIKPIKTEKRNGVPYRLYDKAEILKIINYAQN